MKNIKNKKVATLIERVVTYSIYRESSIVDYSYNVNEITDVLRMNNIISTNQSVESLLNIDEKFTDKFESKLNSMKKIKIKSSDSIYDEIVDFANNQKINYASDFFIKNNENNELIAMTDLQFLLLLIQYYIDPNEMTDFDYNEIVNNSDEYIRAYNKFIKK